MSKKVDHQDDGPRHECLVIKRLLPNRRIDKYLRHRFPDFSRTLIQRLIQEQAVTVNGLPTKSSYQLSPNDRVDLILPPPPTNEIEPEDIPLDIIYEDEYLLVLNKQAGLIVHPARGNRGGTLVNGLVHYSDSLSQVNEAFRPGIVHRLDRNTTGVIVVAKTDTAHWRIAHQFEHRLTRKMYIAVVQGTMDLDSDVISLPLGRHPRIREKYAVRPDSGKEATTTYQCQRQYRGYALLKLMPRTGRTHQLRIHTSAIKHPVVADTMYGGKMMTFAQLAGDQPITDIFPLTERLPDDINFAGKAAEVFDLAGRTPDGIVIARQALHAAQLRLRHPVSGLEMCFEAPLPEDMRLLITLLESYRTIPVPKNAR